MRWWKRRSPESPVTDDELRQLADGCHRLGAALERFASRVQRYALPERTAWFEIVSEDFTELEARKIEREVCSLAASQRRDGVEDVDVDWLWVYAITREYGKRIGSRYAEMVRNRIPSVEEG